MVLERNEALSIRVSMRAYYSTYHLWAARHFARLAGDVEKGHSGRSTFKIDHRSYVTNAILSAVCFLEAAINELFQDAADGYDSYIAPLRDHHRVLMAGLWDDGEGRAVSDWSTLGKYQAALICTGHKKFSRGTVPFQDAKLVIRLRNTLTHFRPETRTKDDLDKLTQALKGKGFPLNPLITSEGNPFFPDKCLGSGCAEWVVESVTRFADEFFRRVNVQPNYQRVDFGAP